MLIFESKLILMRMILFVWTQWKTILTFLKLKKRLKKAQTNRGIRKSNEVQHDKRINDV